MPAEKALTIDPVWAWAIMAGVKRVENRTWRTRHRGRLWIHAGQGNPKRDAAARATLAALGIDVPSDGELVRGAILGSVELVIVSPTPRWPPPGTAWLTTRSPPARGAGWWRGRGS